VNLRPFRGFSRRVSVGFSGGIALITRPSVRSAYAFALAEKQKSVRKVRYQALSRGRRHPQPRRQRQGPCEAAAQSPQGHLAGFATYRNARIKLLICLANCERSSIYSRKRRNSKKISLHIRHPLAIDPHWYKASSSEIDRLRHMNPLRSAPYRLIAMMIGTVTTSDRVERRRADADSASIALYLAASRTTIVARGKLQHTSASRANGLCT
jgi:hypothetical protein